MRSHLLGALLAASLVACGSETGPGGPDGSFDVTVRIPGAAPLRIQSDSVFWRIDAGVVVMRLIVRDPAGGLYTPDFFYIDGYGPGPLTLPMTPGEYPVVSNRPEGYFQTGFQTAEWEGLATGGTVTIESATTTVVTGRLSVTMSRLIDNTILDPATVEGTFVITRATNLAPQAGD